MPPQNPSGNNFDFIMKEEPKAKKSFALFNLPKPVLFILIGVVGVVLIMIGGTLLKPSNNTDSLVAAVASANEIIDVSNTVAGESTDTDTKNVATLTVAVLSSQKQQLIGFVKKADSKSVAAKLTAPQNPNIKSQLEDAKTKNTYEKTYLAYLKSSLNTYQQALTAAYQKGTTKSQPVIDNAYISTKTLLVSPQLQ